MRPGPRRRSGAPSWFRFERDSPAPAIPEYLVSVSGPSPLYIGGRDKFEQGYGKPAPWMPGLLYLKFDEAAQLVRYYLGIFIGYDRAISDGGACFAGLLMRSPTGARMLSRSGWLLGADGAKPGSAACGRSLLPAGREMTGAVSYRKARARG